MVCHPSASTCYVNLSTKFEDSISTHYKDIKDDTLGYRMAVFA